MRLLPLLALVIAVGVGAEPIRAAERIDTRDDPPKESEVKKSLPRTNAQWCKVLTPEQYRVTRLKGTELAFTGKYWNEKRRGIYHCVCCDKPLFSSETKFRSGTGWPSFWAPIKEKGKSKRRAAITTKANRSLPFLPARTEVLCRRCGAHLGHVFDDGPQPTNLRYCLNSAALKFVAKAAPDEQAAPSE